MRCAAAVGTVLGRELVGQRDVLWRCRLRYRKSKKLAEDGWRPRRLDELHFSSIISERVGAALRRGELTLRQLGGGLPEPGRKPPQELCAGRRGHLLRDQVHGR